jgi:hypothetical protein
MARLVVTPGRVALVDRAVLLARLVRTLRRCLAVPVALAVMPGLRALVRPGLMGLPALRCHAMVVLAARAALVALAQTAVPVEQAGLEPRAAVAVAGLAWLPRVALAVSVASAALGSMQAV